MKAAGPATARARSGALEAQVVQAVRNSLNLPRLQVQVRRGNESGCRLVCLKQGRSHSEWLELNSASIAIVRKVGLLPPRLLGVFRLAYDGLQGQKPGVGLRLSRARRQTMNAEY
jgi:hypothetical protein